MAKHTPPPSKDDIPAFEEFTYFDGYPLDKESDEYKLIESFDTSSDEGYGCIKNGYKFVIEKSWEAEGTDDFENRWYYYTISVKKDDFKYQSYDGYPKDQGYKARDVYKEMCNIMAKLKDEYDKKHSKERGNERD